MDFLSEVSCTRCGKYLGESNSIEQTRRMTCPNCDPDPQIEVQRLKRELEKAQATSENHQKVLNYWFPILGYSCANEMVYPALGDPRAKESPVLRLLKAPMMGWHENNTPILEYIHKKKRLSIFFGEGEFIAVQSWGTNVHSEMISSTGRTSEDLRKLFDWLTQ
ncbi:MAG: hypothetical protein WC824_12395 [Bacteroidota bacterium]|jgi:hypothetical protein